MEQENYTNLTVSEEIPVNNLLSEKNRDLYEGLCADYKIVIQRFPPVVNGSSIAADLWTCSVDGDTVNIKTHDPLNNTAFFTHELLHVELERQKFASSTTIYWEFFYDKGKLGLLVLPNTVASINNSMAHCKMFDKFLELGYEASEFTNDFHKSVDTVAQIETIKSDFNRQALPNKGITGFIAFFFFLKLNLNTDFNAPFSKALNQLNAIDEQLFCICNKMAEQWIQTDDVSINYTLFKTLAAEIESWANNRFVFGMGGTNY